MTSSESAAQPPNDDVVDQLAAVQAWIAEHGARNIPVLIGPAPQPEDLEDDREIEFTHGLPWLSGKDGAADRFALIRLGASWRPTRLDALTVHPLAAALDGVAGIEPIELDFPPPDCAYCEIALSHDGDGWYCEQCRASWDSSGHGHHTRRCVEAECDGDDAELTGADGQPRCRRCAFLVAVGRLEPTGPYQCGETYCGTQVTGMPAESKAARNGRCGQHQQQTDSDQYWKDYLAKKKATTVELP